MGITKEKMKRPVNMNFIMLLSLVVLLFGIAFTFLGVLNTMDEELFGISQEMDEIRSEGDVEDVDGFALSVLGMTYVMGWFASMGLWLVLVACPIALAILIFLLALVARLIYSGEGGRLLVYRIIMTLDYMIVGALVIFMGSLFTMEQGMMLPLLVVVAIAYLVAILFLGIRNTYSARIKN